VALSHACTGALFTRVVGIRWDIDTLTRTNTHTHTHTHDQDLRERATVGGVARAKALSASNDEVNAPRDDAFCLGGSEIRWRSPPPADAGTTAEDDGELEKWGAGDEVAGELREVCFAAPSPNDL